MWKSEGNFWELLLSSYHMGFGIQTQIISLGSKPLYPVDHLPSPQRLSYSPYYTAITTLDCSSGAYYWPKGESYWYWLLSLIFMSAFKMATSCFPLLEAGGAYSRHFRYRSRQYVAFRVAWCYWLDRIRMTWETGLWAKLRGYLDCVNWCGLTYLTLLRDTILESILLCCCLWCEMWMTLVT